MRSFISRRCACCWSDDWRMAATAARWNVASGFDSSAEENCLNSRSRDSFSSSATAVRTWCCTAVVDSAPKWRASTRVTWPWSGPKACSSWVFSSVTTCSPVCPSRCSTSLEAFSRFWLSTSTLGAGLLAVQNPGADLDRVRHHPHGILARVDPAGDQLGRHRVVHDQVVDDQAPDERAHARLAQGCGGFHGQESQATAAS